MDRTGYITMTEDGLSFKTLSQNELQTFLDDPRGFAGVEKFLKLHEIPAHLDNWHLGEAVLIEFNVLEPKQKTVAWRLD